MKFKLTYPNIAVQHISHYTMETLPKIERELNVSME